MSRRCLAPSSVLSAAPARGAGMRCRLQLGASLFAEYLLRTEHGELAVEAIKRTDDGLWFLATEDDPDVSKRVPHSGWLREGEFRWNTWTHVPGAWSPDPGDPGTPVSNVDQWQVADPDQRRWAGGRLRGFLANTDDPESELPPLGQPADAGEDPWVAVTPGPFFSVRRSSGDIPYVAFTVDRSQQGTLWRCDR